jgi:hypothetical protein
VAVPVGKENGAGVSVGVGGATGSRVAVAIEVAVFGEAVQAAQMASKSGRMSLDSRFAGKIR